MKNGTGTSLWNAICAVSAILVLVLLIFTHEVSNSFHAVKYTVLGVATGQPYRASIELYLREHANDPSSVDIVNLGEPMDVSQGVRKVSCTFRAKNAFGALVLETWAFMINQKNEVVSGIEVTS